MDQKDSLDGSAEGKSLRENDIGEGLVDDREEPWIGVPVEKWGSAPVWKKQQKRRVRHAVLDVRMIVL